MVTHPRPDRPLVKVLDFGVARHMVASDGSKARGSGGTPMFMAPEQAMGQEVDARTDVYSAAAMLYTLLAGRDPFEGNTAGEVLSRVVSGQFVPLAKANPTVPKLLCAVVESGLNVDPRVRVQSAEEFAENLRPFADQVPASMSFRPIDQPSYPIPLVAPNRERELALLGTLAPRHASQTNAPRESSVVPIRAPHFEPMRESLLVAPRIPRSARNPQLEVGTDFMPLQGDPEYDSLAASRGAHTVSPFRRVGGNALPALLAVGAGFGIGVVIAWLTGMFG
jgi:serine/threonine protein kinase